MKIGVSGGLRRSARRPCSARNPGPTRKPKLKPHASRWHKSSSRANRGPPSRYWSSSLTSITFRSALSRNLQRRLLRRAGRRVQCEQRPASTNFHLPTTDLLNEAAARSAYDEQELKETAARVKSKFEEFNVLGSVVQINPGPVVTTFEFKPEAGIKYSRITTLNEDLCLALQAESILIERIPGKPTVGIEVPNSRARTDQPARDFRIRRVRARRTPGSPFRWAKTSTAASKWRRSNPCRTC